MSNKTAVTIKDLISKKEKLKALKGNRTAKLYVKSLDGVITIKEPSKAMCLDAMQMDKGNEYLVLHCVIEPNLKDGELQKTFNCVEPSDIVDAIFDPGEIATISTECVNLAGYGDSVKVVNEIKN